MSMTIENYYELIYVIPFEQWCLKGIQILICQATRHVFFMLYITRDSQASCSGSREERFRRVLTHTLGRWCGAVKILTTDESWLEILMLWILLDGVNLSQYDIFFKTLVLPNVDGGAHTVNKCD